MAFDGSLWGRRVQATGQTPVATATGFVALFTLDNFQGTRNEIVNGGANSALNGGGDIRVSTDDAGANQLPLEIVQFTVSATPSLQAIQFWVRFPTYEAANRAVWVFYNRAGQTQPPVTDPFGRNAVWQDLNRGFHGNDLRVDVSGNTVDGTFRGTESLGSDSDGVYTTLNGTNTYVTLPDSIGTQTSLTISSFVEIENHANIGWTFAHSDFGSNSRLYFGVDSSEQFFTVIGSTANTIPPSLSGKNVLTAVINGNQVTHYVNGIEVLPPSSFSGNAGSSLPNSTAIGAYSQANGAFNSVFNGRLYDLLIDQRAKDANHIALEDSNRRLTGTFWTMGEPEDTGGVGTITVTESLKNVSYTPFNPVVTLTGGILVNEQLNSVSYSGLNPTIILTGVVSVVEQLKNTQHQANNPIIDLTGSVDIVEKLSPINYSSINPSVTLTPSPIEITESLSEVSFVSRNPSILLTPEPIGIVSTVVFNGVLLDLSFDGDIKNTFFNGKIKDMEFNGSLSDLEFNGTITSKDVNGTIK